MHESAVIDAVLAPRSPLSEAAIHGSYGAVGTPGVNVGDVFPVNAAVLHVRSRAHQALRGALEAAFGVSLPTTPARCDASGYAFIWSGRDRWLVLGGANSHPTHDVQSAVGETASATEMSGAMTVIRIEGLRARDALSKLIPIDLDPAAFGPGAAALTMASHIPLHIWRLGSKDAFELSCTRSFATSLWSALTPCMAEFGYRVAPFAFEAIEST